MVERVKYDDYEPALRAQESEPVGYVKSDEISSRHQFTAVRNPTPGFDVPLYTAAPDTARLERELAERTVERDALIEAGFKCCDGIPNPELPRLELALSFIDSSNTARKAANMLWQDFKERAIKAEAERDALAAEKARLVAALRSAQEEIMKRPLATGDGHEHDLWLRGTIRSALSGTSDPLAEAFPQPDRNRAGKEPCGECRIKPGETCDICGASVPVSDPLAEARREGDFPTSVCTAWEDCKHDGVCHDPVQCALISKPAREAE